MKLYTEKQVIESMTKCFLKHIDTTDYDYELEYNILKELTPIELPSDEDIEKECLNTYRENPSNPKEHPEWDYGKDINAPRKRKAFIKGAKWIKEQILNQNK